MIFGNVSEIDPDFEESYEDKIFLTFDIDWAHDYVLKQTVELIAAANVKATFFVTHNTPVLKELVTNKKIELGIHPNFNPLLNGNLDCARSAIQVTQDILEVVPDASSVRSHSMTQSSQLMNIFAEQGITHDCNHFIPMESGIELKPWKTWNGLIKVPYFWEDDIALIYNQGYAPVPNLLNKRGLKVFDFHPIHLFLNSESIDRYEQTRAIHRIPDKLKLERNSKMGVRDQLMQLLESI